MQTAQSLLLENMTISMIVKVTNLSEEKVEGLKQDMI